MEENGKKWKKSVVDVQIEGVLVRSCLDSGDNLVLIVGMVFIFIVGMITQDITYDSPKILR